jgi:hypothetical protein
VESWKQDLKKLHSAKEVVDMITHAASCADCGKAYDDWYYSSDNPNWEKYMKEDRQFRKAVEERKKGAD